MPLRMFTVDVQDWNSRLVDMHTPNVLTHVYLRSTVDVQAWDGSMFILGAFAPPRVRRDGRTAGMVGERGAGEPRIG